MTAPPCPRAAGRLLFTTIEEPEPEDDDAFLTDWERDFLYSIECQDFDLTERQEAKLAEIEQAIEDRRMMWRNGYRPASWGG